MLVFFSDIHLTDGTTGKTLNPKAFDLLVERVAALSRKRAARRVWCVLLGDGLDLIRSARWCQVRGPRPWDPPGPGQEAVALDVLGAILRENREAVRILGSLPEKIAHRRRIAPGKIRFDYLLGNHDWLINRYRSARQRVVEALGLERSWIERGLPTEFPWTEVQEAARPYGVVARHGDVYDPLNYDRAAGRDASSVGDAVVVELISRLPEEVQAALLGHPGGEAIVGRLRQIDSVRPLTLIPEWVVRTAAEAGGDEPEVLRAVRRGIRNSIDAFRRSAAYRDFCRRSLAPWQRFYLNRVLFTLRREEISRVPSLAECVVRVAGAVRSLRGSPISEYGARALGERLPDGARPRVVVYGHTHKTETVPLGRNADGTERFYLNTGTWQQVWERGRTGVPDGHFAGWREMTYVVIYPADGPDQTHTFETWTGTLCP